MAKGNNQRGNREAKKPKREKPKTPVAAVSRGAADTANMLGKKPK